MESVNDLAKQGRQEDRKMRAGGIPVMIILVGVMLAAIGSIIVPFAVIVFTSFNSVTDDMTSKQIVNAMDLSSLSVGQYFSSFAEATTLISKNPAIGDAFRNHYADMSLGFPNITLISLAALMTNKIMNSVVFFAYPNATGLAPPGSFPYNSTGVGVIGTNCAYLGVTDPNTRALDPNGVPGELDCYGRLYNDFSTGQISMGSAIDTQTGASIGATVPLTKGYSDRLQFALRDLLFGNFTSSYEASYIGGVFDNWNMEYLTFYTPVPGDNTKGWVTRGFIPLDTILSKVFNTVKPTASSLMFMVDDQGLMFGSSLNGTIANKTVRYTPLGNPNVVIDAVGRAVGAFDMLDDTSLRTMGISGAQWIVATRAFSTPFTGQRMQIVLAVPRSDYYGARDSAIQKSLAVSLAVLAVGIVVVGVLGFFASRPLKALAVSIDKLTRFDFSVLENGSLKSRSIVSEIAMVETTFLTMTKAFAVAIRKNRELVTNSSYSGVQSANQAAGEKY